MTLHWMSCRFVDTKVIADVLQGCQVCNPPACRRETRPALEGTVEGAHVGISESFHDTSARHGSCVQQLSGSFMADGVQFELKAGPLLAKPSVQGAFVHAES